jgi:hypothetical protein
MNKSVDFKKQAAIIDKKLRSIGIERSIAYLVAVLISAYSTIGNIKETRLAVIEHCKYYK